MNEELKQQLTQFLAKALDVANKGIDATGEQIPLILQEIVSWQLWSSIGFLALFTSITVLGSVLSYYIYRHYKRTYDVDSFFSFILVSVTTLFVFFASLIYNLPIILKVLIAPRLIILEYLQGLL